MTRPAAAAGRSLRAPGRAAPADAVHALDQVLFTPSGWFALDAGNRRVPGVRPGSLASALSLVGQGQVATVVGRLRPGVVVVDVDAGGEVGDAVVTAVRAWCVEQGTWHLVRASGGGPGRWHVFCAPGDQRGNLVRLLEALRAAHGVRGTAVDLRRAVRPLSAPHRTGAPCPPPAGLAAALRGLCRALGRPLRSTAPSAPAPDGAAADWSGAAAVRTPVAVPLARPRRELPPAWAAYLVTAAVPALPGAEAPQAAADRSLVERLATYALVAAGHDEASAWAQVAAAHPGAFTKARDRGRAWWTRYVWADAVRAADAWLIARPGGQDGGQDGGQGIGQGTGRGEVDPAVLAAAGAARAALVTEWLSWGRDERHSMRAVLEALLERMERTGSTTVPCPERDLLLDTPLSSRTTVRKVLGRLEQAGFGVRRATFSPAAAAAHRTANSADNGSERDTGADARSHTWELADRFSPPAPPRPDPVQQGQDEAVRLVGPPWSHTPPPPVGIWRQVGPAARSAYLALPEGDASPLPLSYLAVRAGAVHGPGAAPTASQLRTLAGHLQTLASLGLAVVDATGRWRRTAAMSVEATAVATTRQRAVAMTVASERAAYADLAGGAWARGRAAARAHQAKADLARRRAWWQGLDPAERSRRHLQGVQEFAVRPVLEQAALKARWAVARARAGGSEADRHDAWIAAVPEQEYAVRVAERTAAFAALPPPLQAAAAAAWAAHRARYGIRRGGVEAPCNTQVPPSAPVTVVDVRDPGPQVTGQQVKVSRI